MDESNAMKDLNSRIKQTKLILMSQKVEETMQPGSLPLYPCLVSIHIHPLQPALLNSEILLGVRNPTGLCSESESDGLDLQSVHVVLLWRPY